MAWTTPKTWTSEPLLSSDLNTHLRDNLETLKAPPTDLFVADGGSDYAVGTGDWVDVDSTDFSLSITPSGDTVLIGFSGVLTHSTNYTSYAFLDVEVNNADRLGGANGLAVVQTKATGSTVNESKAVSFTYLLTGLTPNQELTLRLQWKISNGFSATLHANDAGGVVKTNAQFWVREVS